MLGKSKFSVKKGLLVVLLTVVLSPIWLVFFQIGNFYQYQDQYVGDILRGNPVAARENFKKLEYFYGWNEALSKFWLDGLANKHLFYNASYYRSAFDYLTGNYTKAAKDLENDDSFWALFIKGNIKWRLAQGMYRHATEMKDKKEAEKIKKEAEELAISAKEEYEKAIRKDPAHTLPPKWNYDLINDPDARISALLPKPVIKIPLGYPDPRGAPSEGNEPLPGNSEELKEKKGSPNPKRGG